METPPVAARNGEIGGPNGPRPPAALILSAGASCRFGGSPKACLEVGPEVAVVRMVRLAEAEGASPVVVVVGAHRRPIEEALRVRPGTRIVFSRDWSKGRTASLQSGLRALPPESDVLLWPVDHPFVEARTLGILMEAAMGDRRGNWFVPTFEGRGGHPILLRRSLFSAIFALAPDAPLRALQRERGAEVRRLAVDDPGVVANVDTPEEFRDALAAFQRRTEDLWIDG